MSRIVLFFLILFSSPASQIVGAQTADRPPPVTAAPEESTENPETVSQAVPETVLEPAPSEPGLAEPGPQPVTDPVVLSRLYWALVNNDLQKIDRQLRAADLFPAALQTGGSPLAVAAFFDQRDAVELLVSRGVSAEAAVDASGVPLLTSLALAGREETLIYLLSLGFPWPASDSAGRTPLHEAVRSTDVTSAQDLLDWGFELDRADERGWTPLMEASDRGNAVLVKFLLEKGADPDSVDIFGRRALDLARRNGHEEVASVISDRIGEK